MRRLLVSLSAIFALALVGSAGEGDAAKVIDKVIKAHFPKGVDTKNMAIRTKAKGVLHVQGLDLGFTQEVAVQVPKLRESMELTVLDKKINVVSIYDGKKAWIKADGKDVPVTAEILTAFKEATYTMGLMQGTFLKDKSIKVSLLGEVKVKGKDAIGIVVSSDGKKDINLFCDKATGLIVKVEMRTRDLMSGQEVTEERFITEYQEVAGRKVAKKIEVHRDGKAFMEAEVTEVQILEKIDDAEFAAPK